MPKRKKKSRKKRATAGLIPTKWIGAQVRRLGRRVEIKFRPKRKR